MLKEGQSKARLQISENGRRWLRFVLPWQNDQPVCANSKRERKKLLQIIPRLIRLAESEGDGLLVYFPWRRLALERGREFAFGQQSIFDLSLHCLECACQSSQASSMHRRHAWSE